MFYKTKRKNSKKYISCWDIYIAKMGKDKSLQFIINWH